MTASSSRSKPAGSRPTNRFWSPLEIGRRPIARPRTARINQADASRGAGSKGLLRCGIVDLGIGRRVVGARSGPPVGRQFLIYQQSPSARKSVDFLFTTRSKSSSCERAEISIRFLNTLREFNCRTLPKIMITVGLGPRVKRMCLRVRAAKDVPLEPRGWVMGCSKPEMLLQSVNEAAFFSYLVKPTVLAGLQRVARDAATLRDQWVARSRRRVPTGAYPSRRRSRVSKS
jgi:hypothetical protein